MPQQTLPYDYNKLVASFLNKLLPIFGPDAVIQTTFSVPEIEMTEARSQKSELGKRNLKSDLRHLPSEKILVKSIQGNAQIVFEKLVEEFRELSPYVINKVTAELQKEHEHQ
jgi:hypothetical protein